MATQEDLFLAILALDAYNRGYNPGMELTGTSSIGDATFVGEKADASISFYAAAYKWNGKTIISYRGTTVTGLPDLGDMINGWTLSAARRKWPWISTGKCRQKWPAGRPFS